MLKCFTLENGLKVATYSIPAMRSVHISQTVKSGHIFDTKETSGSAHFMEHLLVQGIPSLPNVEVFSDHIESLAGSYNASTLSQLVNFSFNAPVRHISDILRISSEVFFEPLFEEEAIARERHAVLEEIRQRQDSLWYKNWQFFSEARFTGNHPMKLDGGGTIESVNKLSKVNLVEFWEKFFHPDNTYLTIIGGFQAQDIQELVESHYGKYKRGSKFTGFPKFTNKDMSGRCVSIRSDHSLQTCYVDISFPSADANISIKDRYAAKIISCVLGGLRSSRLFRLLRQKKGLVYDISFGFASYALFGYSKISFQVVPQKLDEVFKLVKDELNAFITTGVTLQELNLTKNFLIDRSLMSFDQPSAIADWIEDDLLWEDRIYTPEEIVKIIESIDKNDLKQVMEKYWDFDKLNLVVQGPLEDSVENISKYNYIISGINI